jgi:hypothetical protein
MKRKVNRPRAYRSSCPLYPDSAKLYPNLPGRSSPSLSTANTSCTHVTKTSLLDITHSFHTGLTQSRNSDISFANSPTASVFFLICLGAEMF